MLRFLIKYKTKEAEIKGEKRGEKIGEIRIAKGMLKNGEPLEKIMKYSKLTMEELDKIKDNVN